MATVTSISNNKAKNQIVIGNNLSNNNDIYYKIVRDVIQKHSSLINKVYRNMYVNTVENTASKDALKKNIQQMIISDSNNFPFDEAEMTKRVLNYLMGYGILQELIENEDISDIDFTRYNHCTIKVNGKKHIVKDLAFENDTEFENFSKLLIIRNGGNINADENHRRESDEQYRLRINVAIPPRNVTGTSLIIRKHRLIPYTLNDLMGLKMLTKNEKKYFENSFYNSKKNTIFVGQGASGKTTLLRACLMESNPLNNYLVVEKDTELYLNDLPNFIIQRVKKDMDGGRALTLKKLVEDALTMSVKSMVVGELVGDESFDFLSAGHTDHTIYGTAHTSGINDTVTRLITMMETGSRNLSEGIIKEIISGAIDDIVYMNEFKVTEIQRITGYDRNTDKFTFLNIKEKLERGEYVE